MSMIRTVMAAVAGAMLAGAMVGFVEGLSILAGDPAVGASVPLYGTIFYALLMVGGGLGLGVGLSVLRLLVTKWQPRLTPRMAWAVSLIALLIPVATVVIRFRVIRDVFHEKLVLASGAGIGVHGALVVFALTAAAALWWLLRPSGRLGKISEFKLTGVAMAALLVVSLPFLAMGGAGEVEPEQKTAANDDRPSVLLVMVDTLRADRLPSYGYRKDTAPNLARFGEGAVQFDHAFAAASWTRPSSASLLTSLPPSAHNTMFKADRLPDDVVTIGEAFKAEGYETGGIVTNYNIAPYFNFGQGFDTYTYLEPDYYFWANAGSSKLSLFNLVRVIREKVAPSSSPAQYYQDAEVTTDAAIAWLDAHRGRPSLLYLTYMDPHDPYFARPLSGESYSRAAVVNPDAALAGRLSDIYDGEIHHWDEHFARLIAHLAETGQLDNMIIAVTADHGEEFQEHGGWWHGTTLYEEQIHVPLIIKPAGGQLTGSYRDDLVSLLDVPPTLAAAAGVKIPKVWHGRDLFGPAERSTFPFAEEDHQGNALRTLRGDRWKLIEANEGNPRGLPPLELFRIDMDPLEIHNEAGYRPEVLEQMKTDLARAGEGAASGAVARQKGEIDEASKERLKSLGYAQ